MYGPYGPIHYRDVAIRPARTEPLAPRARRRLGWYSDEALARLKADLLAQPKGPGPRDRNFRERGYNGRSKPSPPGTGKILESIEHELAERKLDPKEKEEAKDTLKAMIFRTF